MRYSFAAILALASAVLAQTPGFDVITKPIKGEKVSVASTYTVVWEPKPEHGGTVTLSLIGGGDPTTLQALGPIGKAQNSDGKFTWEVAKNLGDHAIYGIQITWDEDTSIFQYSFPFSITGSGGSGGSASLSSSATGTSGSSNSTVTKTADSSSLISSAPTGNLSTTASARLSTVVSTTATTPTQRPTGGSTTSSQNAAAPTIGSTIALFGGLAMAFFAL